jgi:hypothetical protein
MFSLQKMARPAEADRAGAIKLLSGFSVTAEGFGQCPDFSVVVAKS